MSATPDSTLANSELLIADLQRQLAEREAELDEAREQQAATAEVLQVINSSPGDLSPVFDAMLEKALRLCEASFGVLFMCDGEIVRGAATRNLPPQLQNFVQEPFKPSPTGFFRRAAKGDAFEQIKDLGAAGSRTARDPRAQAFVEIGGARTTLSAALRKDDAVLGWFCVYRREVRPFTDKQIALLQNFAAQAVIAMENARLLGELRRRTRDLQESLEYQTVTSDVLEVISRSTFDLKLVLDTLTETAVRLCGAAFGFIATRDGEVYRAVGGFAHSAEWEARLQTETFIAGRETVTGRVLANAQVVHVADVASDPEHGRPEAIAVSKVRTVLGVPLLREGEPVGVITLGRQQVEPFTERQIELVRTFADQAVIAIENTRLITETREALEQQTATAEVLQVINSSPGDLAPVFDAMLERAMRLCKAAFGMLWVNDGDCFRTLAHIGLPAELATFVQRPLRGSPPQGSALRQLIDGDDLVHVADITALPPLQNPLGARAALVELGGARTQLLVALRKDDSLVGIFHVYRREVQPFSDKEIALLQNFAAQAVIAMENARLLTETREALEQQTATAEVLQVINSSPGDLVPVFDAMLEKATRLCEASFGLMNTYDGERFKRVASHRVPAALVEWSERNPVQFGPGTGPARIVGGENLVHTVDLTATEAYQSGDPSRRALVDLGGARSHLIAALRKDGAVLGTIAVYRKEVQPFSEKQIALLENFAAQAVIAMENARLLGELRQRTDEVAELNRGLETRVAEQVEELGRVGRLKRFLAPQLAELIVSHGDEKILESHRRDIVVVFCDLRGYTAFTETAEPEEVLDFLREYHGALGPLVSLYEGTLDQFSGDGIMVFFNDPVPCPDPAERAVKMAMAMREAAGKLIADWRERGRDLGFGAGVAQGYATLGQIGFSERSGYTAIGTVCNVAARLCAEAKDGQILLSQRVNVALKGSVATEQLGPLALKGLTQPVVAYNVPPAAIQPALRVIEGGPESV